MNVRKYTRATFSLLLLSLSAFAKQPEAFSQTASSPAPAAVPFVATVDLAVFHVAEIEQVAVPSVWPLMMRYDAAQLSSTGSFRPLCTCGCQETMATCKYNSAALSGTGEGCANPRKCRR